MATASDTSGTSKKVGKAMVFGVFDGLHAGHIHFLSQARGRCGELIVVLTVPEIVQFLKGREPMHGYEERASAIRKFDSRLRIIASDSILGKWSVISQHEPDAIFLGYDQQGIAKELDKMAIPYLFLGSYHPEKYKSSLLHR